MKTQALLITTVLTMLTSQAYANLKYNPSDLKQFEANNACVKCDLSSAPLGGNHSGAVLDGANLSNSQVNINLSEASIVNANLTKADFSYSNLSKANFTGASTFDANFSNCNLYNATISEEQLVNARSICGAILPDGSKGKCKQE